MNPTDPTALIISAGSGVIVILLGIVIAAQRSQSNQIKTDIKDLIATISGGNGLFGRIIALEGEAKTLQAEVQSLRTQALPRELFVSSTREWTDKLEGIKRQNDKLEERVEKVDDKVEKIDRTLMQPPRRTGPP